MTDRPASWRMPNPKQLEKLAKERDHLRPDTGPAATCGVVGWRGGGPSGGSQAWLPIELRWLSEVSGELLRVECSRCLKTVEI